jgi:hypothetical protein
MDSATDSLFPLDYSISAAILRRDFRVFEDCRPAEECLQYRVIVPREWAATAADLSSLASTGRFRSWLRFQNPETHAGLEISAAQLPREVNASDWVELVLREMDEEVVEARDFASPAGFLPDVLSRPSRTSGGSWLRRTLAIRDADRLWGISALAPADVYPGMASNLFLSLSSFQLLHASGGPAEKLFRYEAVAPVPFGFSYPEAWLLKPLPATGDTARMVLANMREDVRAGSIMIEVAAARQHTLQSVLQRHMDLLTQAGISREEADVVPVAGHPPFSEVWCSAMQGSREGVRLELPVVIGRHSRAWVLAGLVTPDRGVSPVWWAVNKRAYEIVRGSLTIA